MKKIVILLALASCGAGGAPMRPTGEVRVSNHGTSGDVAVTNGRLTIGVGL